MLYKILQRRTTIFYFSDLDQSCNGFDTSVVAYKELLSAKKISRWLVILLSPTPLAHYKRERVKGTRDKCQGLLIGILEAADREAVGTTKRIAMIHSRRVEAQTTSALTKRSRRPVVAVESLIED